MLDCYHYSKTSLIKDTALTICPDPNPHDSSHWLDFSHNSWTGSKTSFWGLLYYEVTQGVKQFRKVFDHTLRLVVFFPPNSSLVNFAKTHLVMAKKKKYKSVLYSVASDSFYPMDCSPPGSSAHGILQARILEWDTISYFRGSSLTQGSNLCLLCILHWQVNFFFSTSTTWEA